MRTAVKMKGFFSLLLLACFCQYCLAKAPEQSIEEILFDSFVSNYSKSYKNDPDTMSMRFKVFQVQLMIHSYIIILLLLLLSKVLLDKNF